MVQGSRLGDEGTTQHALGTGFEEDPTVLAVLASRQTAKELAQFKLDDAEAKAVILMSLPGPHRMSDAQVAQKVGRSIAWIAGRRRQENFAKALKRSAVFVAWSYFPEIVGEAVSMARGGDAKMIRYVLDRFMPNGDESDSFKSVFGSAAMGLEGTVIEELHVRRVKPGHHKPAEAE